MMEVKERIIKTTEEKSQEEAEQDYIRIKNLLRVEDKKHTQPYIQRQLSSDENLRKVFLSTIKDNPALINEIFKSSLLTKPTCYNRLYKLLDLKLINRRFYFDILKSPEKKENGDKEIIKKFEDFTSKMPENLKRYFQAKTSFWRVSEFGKKFIEWAFLKEEEFKEKEIKKHG